MGDDQISLIRRFEPILYFHKDETFFPSDAKRYLEHAALWKARNPFEDKTSWEELIPKGKIAAAPDEVSQPGQPDDIYLGAREDNSFPFLITNEREERFLNPSGWIGHGGALETEATPDTKNQYAALVQLANFYNAPSVWIPALRDSRFWYHAETFDTERLNILVDGQDFTPLDLPKVLGRFSEPFIICYYLFFPGHLEGLQGCESIETGKNFGSFAGEWNCVAVMLDRASPQDEFRPLHLGLASRNTTIVEGAAQQGRVPDHEGRVGMVVHDWVDLDVFPTNDHVKLYVANGTHSLYTRPGQKDLYPQTPGDPSRANCGATEELVNEVIREAQGKPPGGALITIGKGLLGPIGMFWAVMEERPFTSLFRPFGTTVYTEPTDPQKDFPPDAGEFGKVVHPPDFVPPGVPSGQLVSWPVEETIEIDRRTYTIIVDRTSKDEASRQIWFPGIAGRRGYEGRWGPRVTPDPFNRRTGMRFPEFVEMFLVALAKNLS